MIPDPAASRSPGALRDRVRAWRDAGHAAVCDVIEGWTHGTVVRASSYPRYFDFNVVRVEDKADLDVEALASFADMALEGLAHRRVDFDSIDAAERLRGEFEACGWTAGRLLWMRHERPSPAAPDSRVESVPYDVAGQLRVRWHQEDYDGQFAEEYHTQAREVALKRGVQVLVIRAGSEPVAFAQLEQDGTAAEITQVYVDPEHRGRGLGTAITGGAIARAGVIEDLWICADDEQRAKDLYARLGFVPVWRTMSFLRPPA